MMQLRLLMFAERLSKWQCRFDYGLLMFILTFSLVSVTGYPQPSSLFVSIGIYPMWAGDDLYKLVASNVEKLGNFLEGMPKIKRWHYTPNECVDCSR